MASEEQLEQEFQQEVKEHGGVKVVVTHVNTSESKTFRMPASATLQAVFDKAYELLKEERKAGDKYFCEGGLDLAPHLSKTLEQLHREKICRKRRYEIAGDTGGA